MYSCRCVCVVCLVLLFLHSCPGYFLSYQCINTFVDVPDLSPISTKTTNFCSGVLPSFYSVLEFPLLLSSLFFAPCVGNETNLWNLSNFMDTFGMLPLCHQNSQRTILGFYLFYFFTVSDCLYANTNHNFGLALMKDLYMSWRSAIVGVIAFMPVDDHLKPSGSLKRAMEHWEFVTALMPWSFAVLPQWLSLTDMYTYTDYKAEQPGIWCTLHFETMSPIIKRHLPYASALFCPSPNNGPICGFFV